MGAPLHGLGHANKDPYVGSQLGVDVRTLDLHRDIAAIVQDSAVHLGERSCR
jgi:hypothetical protein